ncbi:MAG: hypothetical protein WD749_02770 [Phycisphaerales bacterium]
MHGRAARSAVFALALGATVAGTGCAPARSRPMPGAIVGNQGGAWEAVLPMDAGAAAMAHADASRRDGALAVRTPDTILAAGVWPEPRRDSLDHLRQRFIQSDPRFVAYYGAGPFYRRVHTTRVYIWP